MSRQPLKVEVAQGAGGRRLVLAPVLGCWIHELRVGVVVGPGSTLGRLEQVGIRRDLVLSDPEEGRICGDLPRDRRVPVDHGQVLFELAPLTAEESAGSGATAPPPSITADEGTLAVVAPTDGVFYCAPSPGARPFVEVGGSVREGQPVGLVEVMKTFSHIVYGGPSLPPEARIVEICCGDAQEVRAGQPLILVRALAPG